MALTTVAEQQPSEDGTGAALSVAVSSGPWLWTLASERIGVCLKAATTTAWALKLQEI